MASRETLNKIFDLSETSIDLLCEYMEEIFIPKGTDLVRENQRDDYSYFIIKGCARCYFLRDGKQRSLFFSFEGDCISGIPGESTYKNSLYTIEMPEDTHLLKISKTILSRLVSQSLELSEWSRKLTEKRLIETEHYFLDYFWENKSTQYFNLIKEYPELLKRVSLKKIASYLNVTPQSLSRIRAKK